MSLQYRLIAAISALLLAALALFGALACSHASSTVQAEMHDALASAEDVAHHALGRHSDDEGPGFLADLVFSFDGQRHVQAQVVLPSGRTLIRSRLAASEDQAPGWFRALVDVHPQSVRIPAPAPPGAVLVLSTDPSNETAEAWSRTQAAFVTLLLFCGGVCVLIYLIVGHALRRFGDFDAALRELGDGRYDTALAERGPPEFARLARGFNHMAGRIRDVEQRNRELREQILTLQEEERAEIARDLHDEVGPYLFAISVDAGDIPRLLLRDDAQAEIGERASSIRDAAAHIQKQVRAILRQLRPTDALEFGLKAGIDELIAFWTRRRPEIGFDLRVELGGASVGRRIEAVAYRLVQESISNAVRHGEPGRIAVTIAPVEGDMLLVEVLDDGAPAAEPKGSGAGTGIRGMAERVKGLGGRFEAGPAAEGFRARAHLPLRVAGRAPGRVRSPAAA